MEEQAPTHRNLAASTDQAGTPSPAESFATAVAHISSDRAVRGKVAFGTQLLPALHHACEDRLTDVSWFRTDWQRGGALTGYGRYLAQGMARPVVVKLPVRPIELLWLRRLHESGNDVAPHLFASGETLQGYDLAWVVMERLPHGPLGAAWDGREFDLMVHALGRFYHAASAYPVTGQPRSVDWDDTYARAREKAQAGALPQAQRWKNVLKKARKKLKGWVRHWEQRPVEDWLHGDCHLANAMTRAPAPHGPALLLDFAEARPGHWVEDAVYFEHLFWARRDRLDGRRIGSMIARMRKDHGLPVAADWTRWAGLKRILLALSTPAVLDLHGDPQHVQAALEILEAHV